MNNSWKSKYFETTKKESHVNIFRSLEIENYFKQLLKKKNYNLHTYKLNFANSSLQILISAYKKDNISQRNNKFAIKKTELLDKINSQNILKALNSFTKNKLHITLKILDVNKHSQQAKTKADMNSFRFKSSELEQLYPLILSQQNSAKLLGMFVAEQLKKTKRHNFFFNSLYKNLDIILKQKDSKIKGIKILIKGRLNNATRSNNKYIKIGMIPLITKNQILDYSETTAFTSNGTIGVKIWISHKKLQDVKTPISKSSPLTTLKNF